MGLPDGSPKIKSNFRVLQFQERALFFHASGVAGQAAIRADDPMAGDEDRDRVVPDRPADSLRGQVREPALRGQLLRDCAIGRRFAIGDRQQNVPYRAAERRTARVERRQSCRAR